MKITELTIDRYGEVLALMQRTPGIVVRDADSPAAVKRYLERNQALSFIAEEEGHVVGCAMSGHDGRRGYLQHVVVDPAFRAQGIAQVLVARCLEGLAACDIDKTHLDVLITNAEALGYWKRRGWTRRDDIVRFSFTLSQKQNA